MMDILLPGILAILVIHFISDFVLQTQEMASKKSLSNGWLLWHIIVYTIPFYIMLLIFRDFPTTLLFMAFNGTVHFFVDYVSSRIARYYRERNRMHAFFVTIGADQLIHMLTLILSFVWLIDLWEILGWQLFK